MDEQNRTTTAPAFGWEPIVLLLIVLFGAILRFRGLGEDSLWIDEAATWKQTRGDVLSTIVETGRDTYPPLYNLLVLVTVKLAGASEWAFRLPAAIAGSLAIPAGYWLAKKAGGPSTGLAAALLVALSPFAIFYSQEARAYALLMLASTLYVGCAISALSMRSRWLSICIVASAFLLLYSHPYGILTWAAVSGATALVLQRRDGWRAVLRFAGLQAIVLVLFAPWILITVRVMGQIAGQGSWLPTPSWSRGFDVLLSVAGGPVGLAATAVAIAGLILKPRSKTVQAAAAGIWAILLSALLGPVVLGAAFSIAVGSILSDRYFIVCLPPLLVMAAMGLSRIAEWPRGGMAVAVVIAACAISTATVPITGRHGEDWRAAAAYLEAEMSSEDCLLVHEQFTYRALEYYQRQPQGCTAIGLDKQTTTIPPTAAVYVVLSHTGVRMGRIARKLGRTPPTTSLRFGEQIEIARLEPAA